MKYYIILLIALLLSCSKTEVQIDESLIPTLEFFNHNVDWDKGKLQIDGLRKCNQCPEVDVNGYYNYSISVGDSIIFDRGYYGPFRCTYDCNITFSFIYYDKKLKPGNYTVQTIVQVESTQCVPSVQIMEASYNFDL